MILAFMVLWDLPNIRSGVESLKTSRISAVYNEVAPTFCVFGALFGKALQAQVGDPHCLHKRTCPSFSGRMEARILDCLLLRGWASSSCSRSGRFGLIGNEGWVALSKALTRLDAGWVPGLWRSHVASSHGGVRIHVSKIFASLGRQPVSSHELAPSHCRHRLSWCL